MGIHWNDKGKHQETSIKSTVFSFHFHFLYSYSLQNLSSDLICSALFSSTPPTLPNTQNLWLGGGGFILFIVSGDSAHYCLGTKSETSDWRGFAKKMS